MAFSSWPSRFGPAFPASRDSLRRRVHRRFASVTSFRAPYLRFPDAYLDLVIGAGFSLDSSQAKYKRSYYQSRRVTGGVRVTRIPASLTSSALRIPKLLRQTYLRLLD